MATAVETSPSEHLKLFRKLFAHIISIWTEAMILNAHFYDESVNTTFCLLYVCIKLSTVPLPRFISKHIGYFSWESFVCSLGSVSVMLAAAQWHSGKIYGVKHIDTQKIWNGIFIIYANLNILLLLLWLLFDKLTLYTHAYTHTHARSIGV